MSELRLGLAGLGNVGAELARLLTRDAGMLSARAGRPVRLVAVSARDRGRDRGVDLSKLAWEENAASLAARADVDAVVETIGGAEGAALDLARAALKAGKPFMTANKTLLAHHGQELAALSREKPGAALYFEAAVAGGIPVIKTLREALAGNRVEEIAGILNGTCNYILTAMRETGGDFAAIVKEAQALGYAETDPSYDLDGHDAADKLSILAALAFGMPLAAGGFGVEGIRAITAQDIGFARELGYRIKLLGMMKRTADGLARRVAPFMIPLNAMLAHVEGVTNAVILRGNVVGPLTLVGAGAGGGPTASAVLSDIIDCACGRRAVSFADSAPAATVPPEKSITSFYMRLMLKDQPGVLADITAVMRDARISIQSIIQHGRSAAAPVPVVFLTHEAPEKAFYDALSAIERLPSVLEKPCVLRILA